MEHKSPQELMARMNWNSHNETARIDYLTKCGVGEPEMFAKTEWKDLPEAIKKYVLLLYTT